MIYCLFFQNMLAADLLCAGGHGKCRGHCSQVEGLAARATTSSPGRDTFQSDRDKRALGPCRGGMGTGAVEAGLQSHPQPRPTRAARFQLPLRDLTSNISKTREPVFLPMLCDLWFCTLTLLVVQTLVA